MAKPFTKKGWRNFKIIAGAIDAIQVAIDFIPGYGELANEIIDFIIGICLGVIYWFKKAITLSAFIALLLAFFGEEGTVAAAPLWVLDVWYTQKSAPPSEEEQGTAVAGAYMAQNNAGQQEGPANQNIGGHNIRTPDNMSQRPVNITQNGKNIRLPSPPSPRPSPVNTKRV